MCLGSGYSGLFSLGKWAISTTVEAALAALEQEPSGKDPESVFDGVIDVFDRQGAGSFGGLSQGNRLIEVEFIEAQFDVCSDGLRKACLAKAAI